MQARCLRWLPVSAVLALLAGCSSSSGVTSPTPANSDLSSSPPSQSGALEYNLVSGSQSLVGAYDVSIDLSTLAVTTTPVAARSGATSPPQGFIYDLDIENFLTPSCAATGPSFEFDSASYDVNGDLELGFTDRHPFCAPDFTAAISSRNRADLGYTGRLVVLAETRSDSFFGGEVTTDPAMVVGADGYVDVGDLLVSTVTNDTFPYVLLADDEAAPDGNYVAASGGWQRATALPWVGKDYVHHGSEHSNTLTLSSVVLAASPVNFRVAVVIKYTDPRGVTGRTMRFPPAVTAPQSFSYRVPEYSLDASKVQVLSTAIEVGGIGDSQPVDFAARDWDVAATENADIFAQDDVSLVRTGSAGEPTLLIDAPDLAAAPTAGSVTSVGATGVPGDEIQYTGTLTNSLGTAVDGDYFGLAQFTDPAAALADAGYHFGVNGTTILPDRTPIDEITYQVIPFAIATGPPPDITDVNPDTACTGATVTFTYTNIGTPADNWSWNFGGGATPNTSTLENPIVVITSTPGVYNGTLLACEGTNCDVPGAFAFAYTVSGTWDTPFLASSATINAWTPDMTIYDGKPCYVITESTNTGVENRVFGIAANADPQVPADWTTHVVETYPTPTGGLSSDAPSIVVSGGRLYILYRDHSPSASDGDFTAARSSVVAPAVPTSIANWGFHVIDGVSNSGRDSSVVVHNGLLASAYWKQSLDQAWMAQSTVGDPTSTANWTIHRCDPGATRGVWTSTISYNDGVSPRLVATYIDFVTFAAWVARATVLTPASSADYNQHVVNIADGDFHGLEGDIVQAQIGGNPRYVVSWGDFLSPQIWVAIANTATPTGPASYLQIAVDSYTGPQFRGLDIDVVGGRLAVAYWKSVGGSGNLGFARANNTNPAGIGDFTVSAPDTTANAGYWPQLEELSNGNVGLVYRLGANFLGIAAPIRYLNSNCAL